MELEFPPGVGISPIFNVAYLYKYEHETEQQTIDDQKQKPVQWEKQLSTI